MGLYTRARRDFASTRRVRHVPLRYLLACGGGAVLGLLFIAASQWRRMIVYEILPEEKFSFYLADDDPKRWDEPMLRFDGTSKREIWVPPEVYLLRPPAMEGDFYGLEWAPVFAIEHGVLDAVDEFVGMAGELLPLLPYEGKEYSLLNVTECVNALDHERTEYAYGKTSGEPLFIERYVFHPRRFTESSIFRLPDPPRIFCYEGLKDPEEEFKPFVEMNGLRGLMFREVWRSDDA
jgi:hypothetical protein